MQKIKIIALFGESCAGKDSIQRWLEKELSFVHRPISYTSRPKRDYEQEGKDYHFVSKKEFEELIVQNKMIEYVKFNDWYYGTCIDELDEEKINVGVFDPSRIRNLLQHLDVLDVLPVWIQTKDKERLLRSLKREENPDCVEICRRFLADKEDFSNIDFEYNIFLNDDNNYTNHYYHRFLNKPEIQKFMLGLN